MDRDKHAVSKIVTIAKEYFPPAYRCTIVFISADKNLNDNKHERRVVSLFISLKKMLGQKMDMIHRKKSSNTANLDFSRNLFSWIFY